MEVILLSVNSVILGYVCLVNTYTYYKRNINIFYIIAVGHYFTAYP